MTTTETPPCKSDPDDDAAKAALAKLPSRFLRTAEAYLLEHRRPEDIARDEDIKVRAVYHRISIIERIAGRRVARHSKRGRPRKVA